MRIEKVTAHAFGPIAEQTLELAPGMTLVYGPNEAGKSSWHAALYAGLCGVRRGKGQPAVSDREFREDHKPWDGDRWDAEVLVRLADGRRIEIRQDLAGRVDSRATDVGLGTDVSSEIMFDGSPDGSRWLGLDRRAFLATACIDQAQLLAIADDPGLLQEHIQRAAATRGTDATAAAALDRLADYRRTQVGEDRANSTKPLRRSKVALDRAWQDLIETQRRHEAYLALAAESDAARERADRAGADLRPVVAAVAARRAETARRRADRAVELLARHPEGAPAGLADADDLGNRATSALDAWEHRPSPVALDGQSAEALQLELAGLPAMPVGDLDPAPDVLQARTEYDRRLEARRLVGDRPAEPTAEWSGEPTPPDELGPGSIPIPSTAASAEPGTSSAAAGAAPGRATSVRTLALVGAAVAVAIVGIASLALAATPVGVAALVLAAILGAAAVVDRQRGAAGRPGGAGAAGPVSGAGAIDAAEAARLETVRRETERERAVQASQARLLEWSRLLEERSAALHEAEAALAARLTDHGTPTAPEADLETAFQHYLADCRGRSLLAREATRAAGLRDAIAARRDLEASAVERAERLAAIEADLRRVAAEADVGGPTMAAAEFGAGGVVGTAVADPETIAAALRGWLERRSGELRSQEAGLLEWRELETLLGGRTTADLAADATRFADLARERADGLDPTTVAEATAALGPDPDRRIAGLAAVADESRAEADRLAGRLSEMERGLPSVAEAEERAAAAEAEAARVSGLDTVLQTTMRLLRQAEERIHRDLAPVLGAAIAAQLPRISGGRYVEAAVNPADLAVRVKAAGDGQWREAKRLSHGTREQIYLLLRLAMTEHLVRDGEVAPLLCDEVTVQSDQRRAGQLLDLLHEVSRDRQVVVFTHDERALTWAEAALGAEGDRLIRLDAVA